MACIEIKNNTYQAKVLIFNRTLFNKHASLDINNNPWNQNMKLQNKNKLDDYLHAQWFIYYFSEDHILVFLIISSRKMIIQASFS